MLSPRWLLCPLALIASLSCAGATPIALATLDYPPYSMTGSDAPGLGIAGDIVMRAFALADIKQESASYPWKRAQQLAQSGALICLYPLTRNAEREPLYRWVGVLVRDHHAVFSRAGKGARLASPEVLAGSRITVLAGSTAETKLKELGLRALPENTTESSARLLQREAVDYWMVHALVARYQQARVGDSFEERLALDETESYLGCSKAVPDDDIARLARAIQQVHDSGEARRITARYLDTVPKR